MTVLQSPDVTLRRHPSGAKGPQQPASDLPARTLSRKARGPLKNLDTLLLELGAAAWRGRRDSGRDMSTIASHRSVARQLLLVALDTC